MARQLMPGTPSRSPRYMMPASGRRLTLVSLAVAAIVVVTSVALWALGAHRVASPGPLVTAHSTFDGSCVQCHQPASGVADLRCERCHDPLDAQRFTTAAHLSLAGSRTSASHAENRSCMACHADHRGRETSLQDVDDRRCASCHTFGSFDGHPEIAAVRSKIDPASSLDFSHEIHLRELRKTGVQPCQACHRTTPDRASFEPISFDRHCASCHIKSGVLTLNGVDTLTSGWTPLAMLPAGTPEAPAPAVGQKDERGRVIFGGVGHRDPWLVLAADTIARALPTPGLAHERVRLIDRTSKLLALTSAVPVGGLSDEQLASWATSITAEIDALDRQIASGPSTPADIAAAIAPLAGSIDPALAPLAAQVAALPASPAAAASPTDAQQLELRRQELTQLLDAVASRTTGSLASRAAELKAEVAALQAETATSAAASEINANLEARLADLDEALDALEGAGGSPHAGEVEAMRRATLAALTGSDGPARSRARDDLLALVDAISARTLPSMQPRVAELRAAVLTLGDRPADLGERRAQKVRLLERIELERALRGGENRGPSDAVAENERTAATHEIDRLNARLAVLDGRIASEIPPDNPRGKAALKGLLDSCLKCHRLNDEETAMRPASPPRRPLPASVFTHQPHLLQEKCETCHASIETSKAGPEVNVPSIATCQSCHNTSQAPVRCETCHMFHPRSAAELVSAPWR